MSEQGRKFDGGKLRYDLIPVLALEETAKVVTKGAEKYDDENWKLVPEGRSRYLAAAMRHIQQWRKGEIYDEEMGTHHIANAISNLMFILEKELQGWKDISEQQDISQEELEEYVTTLPEQKPIQCEHCTHGWLPWPLSAKREGSPCHMCKNGEARKTVADEFYVLGNKEIARIIPESEYGTIRQESLWYPPVEDGGNPWIEYDGIGQPVSDDTLVKVVVVNDRDYKHMEDRSNYRADEIQWLWSQGCEFNVVAYRVV